jgi:hypothetical protein
MDRPASTPIPPPERQARLTGLVHEPESIHHRRRQIYEAVLTRSRHMCTGQFTTIGVADLRLLFGLYDATFFDDLLGLMLADDTRGRLDLRLSSRLTQTAGKCTRRRLPSVPGRVEGVEYEIAISSVLLFQTFRSEGEVATVNGLDCRDRLEALQRVFEHELLHLAEYLAWGDSSCKAPRFQTLARQIFGHADVVHQLMTSRRLAAEIHAIRVGDRVAFTHDGVRRIGVVNRITRRATVLVESTEGLLYSDGKRYATYYVPLGLLSECGRASEE